MPEIKKIGILTGGGDCPGLNAVIRAVVYRATEYDWQVLGVKYGWKGMLNADAMPLSNRMVENILPLGHHPQDVADQPVQGRGRT